MIKPVRVQFTYREQQPNGEIIEKTINEEIEFPDSPPMPFHAFYTLAYRRHWEEKRALNKRIEELEHELALAQIKF